MNETISPYVGQDDEGRSYYTSLRPEEGGIEYDARDLVMLSEQAGYERGVNQRRDEVESWMKAVDGLPEALQAQRDVLEAHFKAMESEPSFHEAARDALRKRIEAEMARGVYRGERVYNYSGNPRYRRSQGYYDQLTEQGDIVRTFEAAKPEIGITGQPIAPGPHIIKNPLRAIKQQPPLAAAHQ